MTQCIQRLYIKLKEFFVSTEQYITNTKKEPVT